ncbi:MAG TPA: cytochrome c3 family protein, partial [Longimicrobiales bacterium]|nr:cytochrome c3 family protein [Longimicrobiales bacterium]
RYHDVQCESCHGPGLTHVENPDATQPLAPIRVGSDLTFGCGECHSDVHHPFVEDWEMSLHSDILSYPASQAECAGCHEGKGALAAFGVNAEYIEKGSSDLIPITCAVCHDPHDATNTAHLRFPIETASVETHLCAQCHNRRTEPDPSSSHGLHPHAPETALLQGNAGWFPPGASLEAGKVVATHGSAGNPGLCATCHVASFDVNDPDAGFVRTVTGHLFQPIPCVDEQGVPTDEDCGLDLEERSWAGCTDGCHGNNAQAAWSALTTATARLMNLNEELRDLLEQADPNLDSPGGPIDATNPTFTVAEGAFFNFALAEFGGPGRPDPRLTYASAAVHNPFFMEQLLLASIDAMEQAYPVRASQNLVRTPQLGTTDR